MLEIGLGGSAFAVSTAATQLAQHLKDDSLSRLLVAAEKRDGIWRTVYFVGVRVVLIVQISDAHIVKHGKLAFGRVDTLQFLRRAVDAINALPMLPDLVLATGDLTDNGSVEEYAAFLEITAALTAPLLPVVGNHDSRDNLLDAFRLNTKFEVLPGFVQYVAMSHPLRILVIDTVTPGSHEPSLCTERLGWIESQLSRDRLPTMLAMHHPPFPAGINWMEPKDSSWSSPLAALVERSPNVVRVVCGHVHRPMTRIWANACSVTAPSIAHQVFPDLTIGARPRFNYEAPGFVMHQWTGEELVSYNVAIPGFSDLVEF